MRWIIEDPVHHFWTQLLSQITAGYTLEISQLREQLDAANKSLQSVDSFRQGQVHEASPLLGVGLASFD